MKTANASRLGIDSYFELVRRFPLRPIKSDADLKRATAILLSLARSRPEDDMDAGEQDYVEALSVLMQRFEEKRLGSCLPKQSPVGRLKFLMEQTGMNVSQLGQVIGSQPAASLILHGKRGISKAQILKIARHFSVSSSLFME